VTKAVDPKELHSVAVAAIVRDEQGRLLVMRRRDHGNWEPPGGTLRASETLEDGLVREVLEETRVRIAPVRLSGVYKNVAEGVVTIVFEADPVEGEAHATDEALDVGWLAPEDVARALGRDYGAWVKDAISGRSGAAVRAETGTLKGASSSPTSEL
jgi:8-oxo-dGTP diphosphatase